MISADPFTMPDVRQRHARGANRNPYAPIDRRAAYVGPLPDPRAPVTDLPRGWLRASMPAIGVVLLIGGFCAAGLVLL